MELWLKTPLAPPFIEVSNFGNVRSTARIAGGQSRKALVYSPWRGKNGYMYVSVKDGHTHTKHLVHRLVAAAHCPNFSPELSVNHKDGNKLNNVATNLEWVTLSTNSRHEWEIGLVNNRGETHPNSKLSNFEVSIIRSSKSSAKSLATELGVSQSTIFKVRSGLRWPSKRAVMFKPLPE